MSFGNAIFMTILAMILTIEIIFDNIQMRLVDVINPKDIIPMFHSELIVPIRVSFCLIMILLTYKLFTSNLSFLETFEKNRALGAVFILSYILNGLASFINKRRRNINGFIWLL